MKNSLLFFAFLLFLFVGAAQEKDHNISSETAANKGESMSFKVTSANPKTAEQAENVIRIAELEKKIADLQNQIDGQNVKTKYAFMQISANPIFNTAFEDFIFASDDFWKNPVDVGLVECSKACRKESKNRQTACDKLSDGQAKIDCYDDSSKRAGKCQANCKRQFVKVR